MTDLVSQLVGVLEECIEDSRQNLADMFDQDDEPIPCFCGD